jgi:HTH-type transcriptional regulator / antitoxin HipB
MFVRTPRDLGALIRDRRTRLGLDQQTLAGRAGVSRKWLIDVERGKAGAEVGLVLRTLDALGLEIQIEPAAPAHTNARTPDIDQIVERARKRSR